MKSLRLLVLLLIPFFSFSQIQGEDEVYLGGDGIEPQFNGGGMEQFQEFVNTHFDHSKVSKPGKMVAAFTIATDGSVQKIKMIQMIDSESAIEMIRVLNECPKWKPASRGGKPISVEIKYPIVFTQNRQAKENPTLPVQQAKDSQTEPSDSQEPEKPLNTAGVEVKPDFPGGIQEFYNFIGKNYRVPNVPNLSGKVFVSFVIEKDGSVTEVKILRDIGHGTGEEAKRVLLLSPKWIPGMQQGKPVRVMYSIPLNIISKK